MSQTSKGLLAISFLPLACGLDFIAIDYLTDFVAPAVLIFIKLSLSALLLLIVLLVREGGFKISRKDFTVIFVIGLFGYGLYYLFEAIGIARTSASLSSIIMASVPLLAMLSERLLFKNKLTPIKITGVIVSIIGVTAVILGGGNGEIAGSLSGVFFMFLAALCWCGYVVAIKPYSEKYSTLLMTTILFIGGTAANIPVVLMEGSDALRGITGLQWALIIASGILAYAISDLLYNYGIGKLSVTASSIIINMLPVVTIVFSYLFFGDMLSPLQLVGGAAVIVSVIAVFLSK